MQKLVLPVTDRENRPTALSDFHLNSFCVFLSRRRSPKSSKSLPHFRSGLIPGSWPHTDASIDWIERPGVHCPGARGVCLPRSVVGGVQWYVYIIPKSVELSPSPTHSIGTSFRIPSGSFLHYHSDWLSDSIEASVETKKGTYVDVDP